MVTLAWDQTQVVNRVFTAVLQFKHFAIRVAVDGMSADIISCKSVLTQNLGIGCMKVGVGHVTARSTQGILSISVSYSET